MQKVFYLSIILLVNFTLVVAGDKEPVEKKPSVAIVAAVGQVAQSGQWGGEVYFDLEKKRKHKDEKMAQRYRDRLNNLNHFSPDEPREFPKVRLSWDE